MAEPHLLSDINGAFSMRLPSVLALVLIATACAPKSDTAAGGTHDSAAPLSASTLDSVKAVDAAFAAGMNAKDTAAVFAAYAEDAKVMPPNSPILDKVAAHSMIAGLLAAGATDFVLTSNTAYGAGDLAYMTGTASMKMGSASDTVKYTEVLRRGADGKWRYVVDMFSEVTPPAAAAKPK
jgi:ketosteroid isomerase-like protein